MSKTRTCYESHAGSCYCPVYVSCTRCLLTVDELAVFPGGICLSCYEKAYDATPEQERETIMRVFNGR